MGRGSGNAAAAAGVAALGTATGADTARAKLVGDTSGMWLVLAGRLAVGMGEGQPDAAAEVAAETSTEDPLLPSLRSDRVRSVTQEGTAGTTDAGEYARGGAPRIA